jgi:hypothetical protein
MEGIVFSSFNSHIIILPRGKPPKNGENFSLSGNSGKPVTLETLSLTKFLRHVFQEQETHDFRKPETCEASDSRMREIRESWCGEEMGSRTCGIPEPRAGDGANFGGQPIHESVGDPVRESRAKTCMNIRRSESRFGNLSRAWFGSHTWRHSRTDGEASQSCCPKKSGFRVWTSDRIVNMLDEKDILVCVHTRNILWA